MSHVSFNRALQKLRLPKTVEFYRGELTILDWPRLVRMSGFDRLYLHLTG